MTQLLNQTGLYVQTPTQEPIAFPLKHTQVRAQIAGNLSRVEVTHRFENPFTATLEATYVFPLPDEAAVDEMEIRIGDRRIVGSIEKRQEAQRLYEQAKKQGKTAGLLEQERDNIFTQSLANIQPGEAIDVTIRYSDRLKFIDGNYEFVFPTIVGPRYIPGTPIDDASPGVGSAVAPMTRNQDTDLVPDASRLNPPILPPGMRCGNDIAVTIEIDAGVEVGNVRSPSHQIQIDREGAIVRVALTGGDTIPNKDFILRYQVAGKSTQTALLAQADSRGGHFALYLIPALNYRQNELVPKDVVFLIDTSGSQMGDPLFKCQELMRRFIANLNPDDTFNIVDFANTTRKLSPVPLTTTEPNKQRAIKYINRLTANGGTEMLQGIRTVSNLPVVDPGRLRSIVLLTDGYIGNENQILAEVQRNLQAGNRLYSFGVGSSVNRFLLNRIAEIGRGISRIIRHDEPTQEVARQFVAQINNPVLTQIQASWEGEGDAPMFYPELPPDLFAQQPLVLSGRKRDRRSGKLHVSGIVAGGSRFAQTFDVQFEETGNPAVAQLWGRDRIKHLTNQMVGGDTKAGVEAITDTALAYRLLSQYTAFVAIDDAVRTHPNDASVSVSVPVAIPEGVSYEGIYSAPATRPMAAQSLMVEEDASLFGRGRLRAQSISTELLGDWAQPEFEIGDNEMPPASAPVFKSFSPAPPLVPKPGMALPPQRLTIVQATGLDGSTQDLLLQHLQTIQLGDGISGEVAFEFQVRKGRVKQIVLDENASSIADTAVLDELRRLLQTWKAPRSISGSIRLAIHVN